MRSPTRIVSTRRRWRLLSPWIVKPSSRVLRKLSGELTTIQYWDDRPSDRPDLRFRLERPGFGAGSAAGAVVSGSGSSATMGIVALLRDWGLRTKVYGLGQVRATSSDRSPPRRLAGRTA